MNVVVTGGCGFVGLNVVAKLIRSGAAEIRIVDNLSNSDVASLVEVLRLESLAVVTRNDRMWVAKSSTQESKISVIEADIRDSSVAGTVCDGADAVVHLAAQTGVQPSLLDPLDSIAQNVIGTSIYLEACRRAKVQRFIAASSLAVTGDASPPQSERTPPRPLSPYGATKAGVEALCSAYWHSYGIRTLALRFANLYGSYAWRKGSVVAAFCKHALSGMPLVVDGDGAQTRDFVYARDVAEIVQSAITGELAGNQNLLGEPLNLATGSQTSIRDLATQLQLLFRQRGIEAVIRFGPSRSADMRQSIPDVQRRLLAAPHVKFHELSEMLPKTVAWFHQYWRPAREADGSKSRKEGI